MKILVTGSRDWANRKAIFTVLQGYGATSVAHGGARGADTLAGLAAQELGIPCRVYPADWNKHGRAAGIIRNTEMLEQEKPDLVVAFWDGTSRGTKHMIDAARRAGYRVLVYGPY